MMKKSTSTMITFFVSFVLLAAMYSANTNVYAQNNTDVISDIPVEEPLLPTTTDETITNMTSVNASGAETMESPEQEAGHGNATSHAATEHGNTTTASDKKTITRDSQTLLLEDRSIPEGSFIHLYDSTPYKIMNGHVAAKLPCNDDNSTGVNVLIGQAPDFQQAELELVSELSTPGELCLYHVDIASDQTSTITDIAIQNNSTEDEIDFPPTSTVVIGVNEIASLDDDHHSDHQ